MLSNTLSSRASGYDELLPAMTISIPRRPKDCRTRARTQSCSFGVLSNQFGFTIAGNSGLVIVVEACADLANPSWPPLQTNTLTGGSSYFSDPQWANYPSRFYRLRSP
jgi:hypothetical protein